MRSRAWFVMSLLSLAVSSAHGQDDLEIFDGVWVTVTPTPGEQYSFNKISGGRREATLPLLGHATVTVSNGKDNSNLKVSGEGFDCYYRFFQTGSNEMVWNLKRGTSKCPKSATLKKEVQANPPQTSVASQPAPAKPPQASVATTPANPPNNSFVHEKMPTAAPEKVCTLSQGDHVVVGVDWNDPDGGLNLRSTPGHGEIQGVIPPNGVGIGVSSCNNNWCYVKYGCQIGWAHSPADSPSLSPRTDVLRRVTGVNANDPRGLKLRTGPGHHYPFQAGASIPYNAVGVIEHTCEASSDNAPDWCLVTYKNQSGWVSASNLDIDIGDIGVHSYATEPTNSTTPWNLVVAAYREKGFTEWTFRNQHGNIWNRWTSLASGNTLIWSKTTKGGRGEGFNCVADARPNFWRSCTRYDLVSGQVTGKVSVQIDKGTVIDRPNPVLGHPVVRHPAAPVRRHPAAPVRPHPLHQM